MSERILTAALLPAFLIPVSGLAADNYRCTRGDLVRRIEIFYEPGRAVPCEVHYYKDTEQPGNREVLWRAQNQSGFCESKTSAFIDELQSQGWDCNSSTAENDSAEPQESPEVDDTDSLAPAEDNN
jgi:hypothetical protein